MILFHSVSFLFRFSFLRFLVFLFVLLIFVLPILIVFVFYAKRKLWMLNSIHDYIYSNDIPIYTIYMNMKLYIMLSVSLSYFLSLTVSIRTRIRNPPPIP